MGKVYVKVTAKAMLLFTTVFLLGCASGKKKSLQINGEVIGENAKSIMLIKPNQDTRFDSIIEIPVADGRFHYEIELQYPEVVYLAFAESVRRGGYRTMPLFLENEKMNLTIYTENEFDKNIVKGGALNAQYKEFIQGYKDEFDGRIEPLKDSIRALMENDAYRNDSAKLLYAELRGAKDHDERLAVMIKIEDLKESGEHLSLRARKFEDRLKPIYEELKVFRRIYVEENPTIVSYYFLLKTLTNSKKTIDLISAKKEFQILANAYPDHPYNELARNLINRIENVRIGKKYIDFSAPDLNGKDVRLSDKINGKVALLDLWATWCGPCIAKSRTMVPLYNEYGDKGFTIVAVAGEFESTDKLVKFLAKEKWAWLNLVDLDRENAIWQKYGVDGGGGGLFLIDEKGIIIAKDPTAEEVRRELESRLN